MAELATSSREDALDLVQDTMLELVRRYATRPADEWRPLFYRILQSRIRDWYRRQKVRNRWRSWLHQDEDNPGEDPLATVADPAAVDPLQQVIQSLSMDVLQGALRRLPLRQQQVFLLRIWEGLDVKATAAAMGCSAGSVKTHYSRAVHSLRDSLQEYV